MNSSFWMLASLVMMAVTVAIGLGLLALATYVVVRVAKATQGPEPSSPPRDAALDVLRERYARGEIDRAEFESRRRFLGI